MKILYVINTGLVGGLQRHVLCLMQALKGVVETAVVINTEIDPAVVGMFAEAGMKVYRLQGQSGHDFRVVGRFKRVLEEFKPDVIHAHGLPILVTIWLWLCGRKRWPVVHSIHTPSGKPSLKRRLENFLMDRVVDYWLPVSTPTWEGFKKYHPKAKGEVFFNPLRLSDFKSINHQITKSPNLLVGMVGRNADQKDWPSFHRVEAIVLDRQLPALKISFLNAGEKEVCDGREAIAKMDLFVMTSKHEELPTTVLECFAIGTPICGFIPVGGTTDILQFSKGPVRNAFIKERSCEKLADIVMDLLAHPEKRRELVEDGRQILEGHFDAEKMCRGRLKEIYGGWGG